MDLQHSSTPSSEQAVVPPIIAGEPADTRQASTSVVHPWWRTAWATRIALIMILLLGAYFRTLGLTTWGAGTGQHPDERFFTDTTSLVRIPTGPLEYFDSARSPGNPRNVGKNFFVYGSFPIALTRLVAVTLTPNAAMPDTIPDITVPMDAPGGRPQIPNPELRVPKLTPLQLIFNPEGRNLTGYHEIYKVGRSLAVLFDLGSILLVFLIGRRLFDRRVGLLAALLLALAVMPIQQTHFFVDPTFSTFFALLALYWVVRMAQGGGPGVAIALGLSIGAGMATRITLATLGLVAIVAAVQAALAWRAAVDGDTAATRPVQRSFTVRFLGYNFPLLFLAGVLTLFTFRVLQPDAFIGSTPTSPVIVGQHTGEQPASTLAFMHGWSIFDVRLDPRFVGNLQEVQKFVTGEIDFYPSQQWVRRADYWFPWKNMVLWGMGPALGLSAWAGWLLFGLRSLDLRTVFRKRTDALQYFAGRIAYPGLLLWIWIAFYFAWQGRQFAATLRYMLPIYGSLIIFSAWLLIGLWEWSRRYVANGKPRMMEPRAWLAVGARWLPLLVVLGTFAWAYAFTRIYTQPHSRVIAAHWVHEHVPPGSRIISEGWDDPLPLAVAGGDPWRNTYQGITSQPYGEDDQRKYSGTYNAQNEFEPGLLDQLEAADYITLTSNRVYGSTVRLPMRYPALMRYYYHLFSGDLGFELVADITSYPKIFGIEIPDQVAEEAFTVYDHPRVLIFRKTDAFSRERAEELITSDVNWGEVYKLPVSVADQTATALRLTESQWPAYRAAGTWSELFSRPGSLINTLAPLLWLIVLELLGLATFALLFRLLPWLPDRGFALARTLGLLLVAYGAWLLGSFKLMSFTPQSVWLCALPLLAGGAWVAWRTRDELRAFWHARKTALLTAEAVYLLAFVLLLLIRWFNPDLWHPARGGEKPMDLAYLNAVLKSAAFPPYDPWFAGGYINYYYFGFVIVGTLVHLTTIEPTIAYNLAVPTLFALTALGAWGAVYNLLSAQKQVGALNLETERPQTTVFSALRERQAQIAALLAPLFVLLLGNLAQAVWFITGHAATQTGRPEWAFWDATRIVEGTVNEFPFFTFLFADLHAHMIVMPFALAVVGLTVALTRMPLASAAARTTGRRWLPAPQRLQFIGVLLLLGLLTGTLRVTNTWDYPTYTGLTVVTLGMLFWWRFQQQHDPTDQLGALRYIVGFVFAAGSVIVVGNLLFMPFIRNFVTESSGAEFWREGLRSNLLEQVFFAPRTSLWEALQMYGLWLFLLTSAGLLLVYRRMRLPAWFVGAIAVFWLVLVLIGIVTSVPALLLLLPLLFGAAVLALRFRRLPPRMLLPLLWAGTALALAVMVEIVVVRGDIGRMNTVFKFGIHTWTLFGLATAVALPWMAARLASMQLSPILRWSWTGAAGLLMAAALIYPLTATPARIGDRFPGDLPRTLDGMAFMRYVKYTQDGLEFPLSEDAAAITWLQQNVTGTPVIIEAHLPSYQWAGRIATYTGLPTLLGWEWHQIQQRNAVQVTPIVSYRQNVIAEIFNGTDVERAWQHIQDYAIEYIYVGGVERAMYAPAGLAKFETLTNRNLLDVAFTSGNTTIYRVVRPGTPTMLTTDLPVDPPTLDTPPPLLLDQPVNELPAVEGYAWNSWASANSWLAALVWLAALYLLTLLGLPLAVLIFGRWRDGGLVWARLIGLLLLGYAVWLPTSFSVWRYDAGGMLGGLLLLLALNVAVLLWMGRTASLQPEQGQFAQLRTRLSTGVQTLGNHLRARYRNILIGEGLFLGGFALFVLIRAFNPDLWHPTWGGEKPMEFGFLNAILRSPVMPPFDPFFSDGYINYYYYGIYLVSLPIKLTGIDPAVAFNLVIPTLFGLMLAGGYTLVAQITGRVRYGLIGAAFLTVLGNLATVFPVGWSQGLRPVLAALSREGFAGLGRSLGTWYIGPSRVIWREAPDQPLQTINEFPFWSFLFADLHPHMIALPIALLAIALAWELLGQAFTSRGVPRTALFLLTALTLGTLAVTNSWDFPTYTLLIGAALCGAAWRSTRQGVAWLRLGQAVLLAGLLAIGGMACYIPFFDHFYALVSGIGLVRDGTRASEYLAIYGLFLAILLPVILGALWRLSPRHHRTSGAEPTLDQPAEPAVSEEPPLVLNTTDTPAEPAVVTDAAPARHTLATGSLMNARWLMVVIAMLLLLLTLVQPVPGLQLWLGMLLISGALLLLQRRIAPATWFAFLLATLAWAVSLGIEVIFIGDHLMGGDAYRMNTVFKFGMQIWTLMALAAAISLPLLLRGLRRVGGEPARTAGLAVLIALITLTALFPLIGIPNRIANRFPVETGPTLDGLAFLEQAEFTYNCATFGGCEPDVSTLQIDLQPDAAAIAWLNENITGTPIVLQSNLWFYRAYGIRVAANTGLPTVISALHVDEQRDPTIAQIRNNDIDMLYRTTELETTLRLLAKYDVNYIYVGSIEHAFYNAASLAKFVEMEGTYLEQRYTSPGVQIYQVNNIPSIYAEPETYDFAAEEPIPPPPPPVAEEETDSVEPVQPEEAAITDDATEPAQSTAELAALEEQVATNPENSTLAFGLAERYRAIGRLDDAAEVLEVAAEANPGDIGMHHLWGDILAEAGRYEEAEAVYMLAAQNNPTAGNWNKLATALLDWGNLEKAEMALSQALSIDDTVAEPYYRLGQLYQRQGNEEQAIAALQSYLQLAPAGPYHQEARQLLAEIRNE